MILNISIADWVSSFLYSLVFKHLEVLAKLNYLHTLNTETLQTLNIFFLFIFMITLPRLMSKL